MACNPATRSTTIVRLPDSLTQVQWLCLSSAKQMVSTVRRALLYGFGNLTHMGVSTFNSVAFADAVSV